MRSTIISLGALLLLLAPTENSRAQQDGTILFEETTTKQEQSAIRGLHWLVRIQNRNG